MNQLLYSEKTEQNNSVMKILIVVGILLLVIFGAIFFLSKQIENKVLANVYVGNVNIGLKEKEEAVNLAKEGLSTSEVPNIKLVLGNKSKTISPKDVDFRLEKGEEALVDEAYEYGRDGNIFSNGAKVVKSYFKDTVYEVNYTISDEKLASVLKNLTSGDSEIALDDSYEVSGDEIIITKGSDGMKVDSDLAKEYIITAFCNQVTSVNLPTNSEASKKLNMDEVYAKVATDPVDAKIISGDKFEIIPEKKGISFDKKQAEKDYKALKAGETMTISLVEALPKVTLLDLESKIFDTKLSSFSTKNTKNDSNLKKNISVACGKVNNKVVNPGEEFSLKEMLGPVNSENGFVKANRFEDGKNVSTMGSGINQVSSALYNAALLANLNVTERTAHATPVSYTDKGLDADFIDNSVDLKFKNSRNYPVKITAIETNGEVFVDIYGMKEANEPVVTLETVEGKKVEAQVVKENDNTLTKGTEKVAQESVDGYEVEVYRVLKNEEGKEISKKKISSDTYKAIDKIVKVGTKVVTPKQTPTPTKTPVTPSNRSEDPEIVIYDNDEDTSSWLPSGWDSPESPYSRH